jgi:hypothetical protein
MAKGRAGRSVVRVCVEVLVVVSLVMGGATPAFAAKPAGHASHGGGGGGGGTSTPTGNDVSYPQCGSSLPASPAFGIVGVTGGLANDLNPCFGPSASYPSYTQSELYWALSASTGKSTQPKASLYVNTADPGNVYNGSVVADWPTSGTTPYGSCTTTSVNGATVGENSDACAWQYGYNKAAQDAAWLTSAAQAIAKQETSVLVPASASGYPWWLDVETANTWQSDTSMNVADLQGMVAAAHAAGVVTVGIYSTASQWSQVAGSTTSASGSLWQLPDWIPGATSLAAAQVNCSLPSFTGGVVKLTQWTAGGVDQDDSCVG